MRYTVLIGDCIEQMRTLPDQYVHTCVTSPPYFGLRDYGHEGQIGLEGTPDAFVAKLVDVFREVRRVLRDDGTLWLNLSDSYAGTGKSGGGDQGKRWETAGAAIVGPRGGKWRPAPDGLKHKDLIGIPWRVAFALQADGWYLRQDIIWSKPNPMPESVTDRNTKSHEYMFLLSKQPRYFYDHEAIKEPSIHAGRVVKPSLVFDPNPALAFFAGGTDAFTTHDTEVKAARNRRSVWTVSAKPYKGAHFATFPPDLIEPCILAGCPSGGTVLDPFGGAGTTAGVAVKHGRKAIICELNPEYAAMVPGRVLSIAGAVPDMFMEAAE